MICSYSLATSTLLTACEVPKERIANKAGEINITASGCSQPPILDSRQLGPSQVQVATSVEMTEAAQADDSIISDNFTLSGAATPAQGQPVGSSRYRRTDSNVNPEPQATDPAQAPMGKHSSEKHVT